VLTLAPPTTGIWLLPTPTDMRKSFDGLLALAAEHCQKNVLDGGLFLFVNKRRDRVKLLWWDEDGLVIWYKRLEQGTFEVPAAADASHVMLTPRQLSWLLGGIELASVRERHRYRRPK
jgi:transposase